MFFFFVFFFQGSETSFSFLCKDVCTSTYILVHTKKFGQKAYGPRKRRGKLEVRFRTYVAPMCMYDVCMYVEYCLVQVEKKKE